ncbi:putative Agmatinase [[Clostridium] ultunense Esp]|nr:putative Agmatinase [[Clostridium] ultunense Esp]
MSEESTGLFVINPSLSIEEKEGRLFITLLPERRKISTKFDMYQLIQYCNKPRSLKDVKDKYGLDNKFIQFLLSQNLLVPVDRANLFAGGILSPSLRTIGFSENLQTLISKKHGDRWCLFGVPVSFEKHNSWSSEEGPEAIRSSLRLFENDRGINWENYISENQNKDDFYIWEWNRRLKVSYQKVAPFDLGNICYKPSNEVREHIHKKVEYVVEKIVQNGGRPLVLGGEHSITKPIIDVLFKYHERFTIIHFDAHTDRYENNLGNRNCITPGNVISKVINNEKFHQLYQMGIREFEWISNQVDPLKDSRIFVFTTYHLQSLEPQQIFRSLSYNEPIYISVDADVFDPTYAPEVTWPVMGGLTFFQMFKLFDYLIQNYRVIGADFVEVCGPRNGRNLAASCLANLITILLLSQVGKNT